MGASACGWNDQASRRGGEDLRAAAVAAYHGLERHRDHAFSLAEALRLASWVGERSWDSDSQRAKGVRSGVARRDEHHDRDRRIAAILELGISQRRIAEVLSVSRSVVENVKKRTERRH